MTEREITPPLAGIRVLETATLYAAPMVATLLADHGAEVVKIEPPGGDPYRQWPAMWALVGRGKRSLTLDLASPEGCDVLRRLLPRFDVLVQNLPHRLAVERGLTREELRKVAPDLVIVSATGFGSGGPYADRPANGTLGEAFAGLTGLTGDPLGPPVLPSVPLGDMVTAAFGAFGALAGVVRTLRRGGGADVELTSYEPLLHALGPVLSGFHPGTPPPTRDGGAMGVVLRGTFCAADGDWLAISCGTPRQERAVATLVGASGPETVRSFTSDWVAARPRQAALDLLVSAGIPAAPVNDLAAVVADPHVNQRGSLIPAGDGFVAAPTPRIDGATQQHDCPALGDANDRFLHEELGLDDRHLKALGVS